MSSMPDSSEISGASDGQQPEPDKAAPRWTRINAKQRRVLGVLIEKARTTPDAYPLTLNGLTTGCNQKSNRSPQMNLNAEAVEETLDELRGMGAVAEVHSGGRVAKYRHYAYDWFGVDKREIAVLCELMLRGEQTLGDLRARASRMESIRDQRELRDIVDGLLAKQLMLELTPPGRGQIVTHGLYTESERASLTVAQHPSNDQSRPSEDHRQGPDTAIDREATGLAAAGRATDDQSSSQTRLAQLESRIEELEGQLESASDRIDKMENQIDSLLS